MAITVQYGPIAAALGLAQVGGAGAGYNIQAQRDLQALGLQNQMQQTINANDANLIQMAMQRDAQQAQLAAQAQAAHDRQVAQQAQQQQAASELAARNRQLDLQEKNQSSEQVSREQQTKDLQAQRAQALKEKQDKEAWLNTLTPEQKNAVLSGAGLPIAKPAATEPSPNAQLTDDRARELKVLDALKFQAQQDQEAFIKLSQGVLPDPAQVAAAKKQAEASMAAYQQAAQSVTGPANVKGFTTGPANTQPAPAPAQAPTQPQQQMAPTGPSPYGPGGRKQMPDGSVWTWNGVSWTKG